MRKLVIGAVASAGIIGGSIGVAALNPFGIAGAQDGTAPPATAPPTTAAPQEPSGPPAGKGRMGPLDETLDDLVAKGTISKEQADAVRNGVQSRVGHGKGHGGPPGRGHGHGDPKAMFETAASAIGISPQDLMTELRGGKSVAEVAQAHGVDPQKVIDALVAEADAEIDQAVASGKLPADKADAAKAKVRERVTDLVNGKGFPGKGRGHHGPGDDQGKDDDTDDQPGSTPPPAGGTTPSTGSPTTQAPTSTVPPTPPGTNA